MNWLYSHGMQVIYMPCSSNMVRIGMIYGDVLIKQIIIPLALVRYKIVNGKQGTTPLSTMIISYACLLIIVKYDTPCSCFRLNFKRIL